MSLAKQCTYSRIMKIFQNAHLYKAKFGIFVKKKTCKNLGHFKNELFVIINI